jgi:hypothetical protein
LHPSSIKIFVAPFANFPSLCIQVLIDTEEAQLYNHSRHRALGEVKRTARARRKGDIRGRWYFTPDGMVWVNGRR